MRKLILVALFGALVGGGMAFCTTRADATPATWHEPVGASLEYPNEVWLMDLHPPTGPPLLYEFTTHWRVEILLPQGQVWNYEVSVYDEAMGTVFLRKSLTPIINRDLDGDGLSGLASDTAVIFACFGASIALRPECAPMDFDQDGAVLATDLGFYFANANPGIPYRNTFLPRTLEQCDALLGTEHRGFTIIKAKFIGDPLFPGSCKITLEEHPVIDLIGS